MCKYCYSEYKKGNLIKSCILPWGKIGLTICYDLRFPNLYRKLSKSGCLFFSIPSAFTETTGKRHWHTFNWRRQRQNKLSVRHGFKISWLWI
jgi:predicted amidohydrolase